LRIQFGPPPHHQREEHADHGTEDADRQRALRYRLLSMSSQQTIDMQVESHISIIFIDTTPQYIEKSRTSFHMSLHNVTDELVTQQSPLHDMSLLQTAHDVHPVLTLATYFMPNIQNIIVGPDDLVDPV